MIHSVAVGDYKFPGGGVQEGESHEQALAREVEEESGAQLASFDECVGAVIEYDSPVETHYDVFKMTSHYYLCQVRAGFGVQKLDDYEKDLGFTPEWISIDAAIIKNRSLLGSEVSPKWLKREIFVLEYIKDNLFGL
jgi:8-oxo-dGTP pyrophosphatase MutT (NUDIX family)